MAALPLAGKRVLVTRAVQQAGKLSEGLRALGAEAVEVPVLEIRPPESYEALDRALRALNGYDWLILTSANAVRALGERAAAIGVPLRDASTAKVAAVGEATAAAARKAGLAITLVPESYVAESLIKELFQRGPDVSGRGIASCEKKRAVGPEVSGHDFSRAESESQEVGALAPEPNFKGKRILLTRAAIARDVIPDALRAAGAAVDVVDAYRNAMPESAPELLRAALAGHLDAATFTSSSSVTHLADAARQAGIEFPFAGMAAVSIGPITSQTLREAGWEPAAEAGVSDIPGLVAAVERVLRELSAGAPPILPAKGAGRMGHSGLSGRAGEEWP
ncbi:MAG: uroporphyrinogen-III synthase [Terracidiphilus sp.]